MVGIIIYEIIAILVYFVLRELDEKSGVNPADLIAAIFWPLTVVIVIIVLLRN
jgi:hypothetical protein